MEQGIYNFKNQKAGDTFNGIELTVTRTTNNVETPIDLTGAIISMQIRKNNCLDAIKTINTTSGITITNATGGVFRIDSFEIPQVSSFVYKYDIQFNFSNGVKKTYLEGDFPILNDITR